jgi:hypothetical protein
VTVEHHAFCPCCGQRKPPGYMGVPVVPTVPFIPWSPSPAWPAPAGPYWTVGVSTTASAKS